MGYNQFSITEIVPDYSNKRITINTNFKVDASTVNTSTVELYESEIGNKTEYSLIVNNKTIVITFDDYPKFDTYYLRIEGIKDALKRPLSSFFSDFIYFKSKVKDKLSIIEPIHNETLNNNIVQFTIESTETINSSYYYLVQVSDTISFSHNVTEFTANGLVLLEEATENKNLIQFSAELSYDGQVYIRARVHQSNEIFGDWSEIISFNIMLEDMDSLKTDFMQEYVNTHDLFDEESFTEIVPLEIMDKSSLTEKHESLYMEFNKDIFVPEDAEEQDIYVRLGTVMAYKKDLSTNGMKEKVKLLLLVDPDDASTLIIQPLTKDRLLENCQYTVVLKDLKFEDGTTYSNKEVFYNNPADTFVTIESIKKITGSIVPDDILIKHISEAGKTAMYWAKKNVQHLSQVPDFTSEDFEEEYYPFYKFIEFMSAANALKEVYLGMITNPKKWKDVLSDLQREEEWDFAAMKAFIDGIEREADEWLELVVTITADPKWALRGRHFYSKMHIRNHPYHNTGWSSYPNNTFDRGF